jgi:CMP-N,N'-diacetyllegionaminic acid synthase
MKRLITICARGGSKGIPGKNIKIINGKPLIYYTCKFAVELAIRWGNTDICLSTDDDQIKSIVKELNFDQIHLEYKRPKSLATDSAGKIGVLVDALNYMEKQKSYSYEYLVDLDVTSPLRTIEDLNLAFDKLSTNPSALNLFSVNHANRNPYFNMVELKQGEDFVKLCKQGQFLSRQSAPEVYDVNASFYIYRREFFKNQNISAMTKSTLVYVMDHICFDLDHPIDFEFMTFLLENGKIDFDFIY